jgi:hypothetical protein
MAEQKFSLSSFTPEQALVTMMEAIRHPIYSVDGWAEILTREDMKESHAEAVVKIKMYSTHMVMFLEELMKYVSKYRARNPADDSESFE